VKYAVVYEQTPRNWSAYVPDLPGCVAAGETREEVERLITDGIRLHIDLMRQSGEPVPLPTTRVGSVDAGPDQ
jgi:predicted RNase H-like HicB family nuclease